MRKIVAKAIRKVALRDWVEIKMKYRLSDKDFKNFYRKLKIMFIRGNKNERRDKFKEARRLCSC